MRARVHAALALLPLGAWGAFHLWEQWAAFGGQEAYVDRLRGTSSGGLGLFVEILLVTAIGAWLALEVEALVRRRPEPYPEALAESPDAAARVSRLARASSLLLGAYLAWHLAWSWAESLTDGFDALRAYARIRAETGLPWIATVHAVGITALSVHLWAAIPRFFAAFGWLASTEQRRALRTSALVAVVLAWVLWSQLAGWLATGAGTFWLVGS